MSNTYTKAQLIRICEKAKEILWNGKGPFAPHRKEEYVCFALTKATCSLHGRSCSRPYELTELVKRHIHNNVYLTCFLLRKFGDHKVNLMTSEQIQAWRFLMLDNMIKILKEKST